MSSAVINDSIINFILSLYGDPAYPRKIVENVVKFMDQFIRNILLPALKSDIISTLQQQNTSVTDIEKYFDKYSNVFNNVLTEHKRFNVLKEKGLIDYEQFPIGKVLIPKIVGDNKVQLVETMKYAIHIPLRQSLKNFLEIPDIFHEIINYINSLRKKSDIVINFMQGNLWAKKYAAEIVANDIVLPLYLFYDDLEVGNALGSHAGIQKFGALYASIASLPPRIASRLSTILLTLLVNSKDKKCVNDEELFNKVIIELNFLREKGITIKVKSDSYNVKFQLVLILGDNLGLNGLFGFVESFKANYYCRICKASSDDAGKMTTENELMLRNRNNYEADIKCRNSSQTGIKSLCVFHKIKNFHVTENLTVDMMHDILEGVCVYDIKSIINTFITIKKYFTLEQLNMKIENFDYGFIESCNKPPPIYYNTNNCEYNVNTSAAEMLCLVRYFGLIIGDLIPKNDKYWKLYQYLRQFNY